MPGARTMLAGGPAHATARHRGRVAAVLGGIVQLALSVCACAADIAGPVPAGSWGGTQATLTVFGDSATLELPCAAGRIQGPLVAAADGSFDLPGFWAPMAGPIGIGGANWQPARYTGRRNGDGLDLTIQLSSGSTVGPLQLKRGVVGQFPKCV